MESVTYEVDQGVAWVTLNRPEAHNALNKAVRSGLTELVARFNDDDSARVMVLTGAGDKTFCAGGDLKEMAENSFGVPPVDFIPQFGRTVDVPKPTIAAVNGHALGGGFLLAQNCDLVVAASNATFGITEMRWSRGAPWSIPLPHLIPPRIALQLLLTGDPIGAERAREIGLVNTVVPLSELRATTEKLAHRLAGHPPLAVRAAKETVKIALTQPREEAYASAEALWAPVYSSEDALEGPRAFREGRAPVWRGR